MAHWLFKSEPSTWSWERQVEAGAKGTFWNGVRNHLAKQQMMAMKKGERGFFYHSNEERAIVGIVEIIKEYYPDHTDETGKFGMVDVKAVKALKNPVTLADIKAEPSLAEMALVKNSRLSVQPVTDEEWAVVMEMAGKK
ncbi:EVE domain-containing protein [Methylocystis parvus]|uniref:EVE domain-containing protein n=1 Tax=Methylocystis parvus TaxID=134 RepID=A0A6B8M712_9HYPH|nr:EVE domain-containing protein [Methylocystis parvus]QGM98155.1 EVE domain-containing protein [Methylocystis parvus]WBK01524.1 EVE domain-containing protein [Methylocystis parvus OBBP]